MFELDKSQIRLVSGAGSWIAKEEGGSGGSEPCYCYPSQSYCGPGCINASGGSGEEGSYGSRSHAYK